MPDRDRPDPAPATPFGRPTSSCDAREALFGGAGVVRVWDLADGRPALPFSAVLGCTLEPGGRVGAHQQQQDPELVYVVSGRGVAEVNGAPQELAAGTVVFLPLGSTLALANTADDEPLVYLIIKARA